MGSSFCFIQFCIHAAQVWIFCNAELAARDRLCEELMGKIALPLTAVLILVLLLLGIDYNDCWIKGKVGSVATTYSFGFCYVNYKGVAIPYSEYSTRIMFDR